MWAIVRHGIRNPHREIIVDVKKLLIPLKERIIKANLNRPSKICPDVLQRLQSWNWNVDPQDAMKLSTEGEEEIVELAERMKKRFPTLLDKYVPRDYNLKSTGTERTLGTTRSFLVGLFGRQNLRHIWDNVASSNNDTVLRVSNSNKLILKYEFASISILLLVI